MSHGHVPLDYKPGGHSHMQVYTFVNNCETDFAWSWTLDSDVNDSVLSNDSRTQNETTSRTAIDIMKIKYFCEYLILVMFRKNIATKKCQCWGLRLKCFELKTQMLRTQSQSLTWLFRTRSRSWTWKGWNRLQHCDFVGFCLKFDPLNKLWVWKNWVNVNKTTLFFLKNGILAPKMHSLLYRFLTENKPPFPYFCSDDTCTTMYLSAPPPQTTNKSVSQFS